MNTYSNLAKGPANLVGPTEHTLEIIPVCTRVSGVIMLHETVPKSRASRDEWKFSNFNVTSNKVKYIISTFEPYKSPGPHFIPFNPLATGYLKKTQEEQL